MLRDPYWTWVGGVDLYVSDLQNGGWRIHGRTWEEEGVWKCELGLDVLPDELTEARAHEAVEEAYTKRNLTQKYGVSS